ncbi:hypothetical protein CO663_16945 [Rhizobium anhuiense]|uniref:hypothetical protein n=1 Tax=Rhizobium anhuiense TaxID=1184720 RepID=UPI000BEA0763|nr:hypothetical protein [Rhizobium anhuiense]PDS57767.1 hypothetical protein CO663_16945 [Rhizobium anhuiense]
MHSPASPSESTEKIGVTEDRSGPFSNKPEFVAPFQAWLRYSQSKTRRPQQQTAIARRLNPFAKFIKAYEGSYGIRVESPADISQRLIDAFLPWLKDESDVRPRLNETRTIKGIARRTAYNTVHDFLAFLARSDQFGHMIVEELVFERNVSAGSHKEVVHFDSLTDLKLTQIRIACIAEISQTLNNLAIGARILADNSINVPDLQNTSGAAFKDVAICIKAYHEAEKLKLSPSEFSKHCRGLDRAMGGPPFHSFTDILSYLHFSKRSLVPFVCLLAMHTFFNPDTILTVTWEGLEDSKIYGTARRALSGMKYRGGPSKQTKTFATNVKRDHSPAKLLEALELNTKYTATFLPISDTTPIFCYARRDGSVGKFTKSGEFRHVLLEFISDHNLPHFTLAQFRKTGGDLLDSAGKDDPAIKKKGLNQQRTETTEGSYETSATKSRRAEVLATSLNIRARRVEAEGRMDSRGDSLPTEQRLAATPGFSCQEPYDSPYSDQIKGRLCTAYCCCPDCPLSAVDIDSAVDCARVVQVRRVLMDARTTVEPSRWRVRLEPQLRAIDEIWLPSFSQKAKRGSRSQSFPPLPSVE